MRCLIAILFLLTACASPSLEFREASKKSLVVEGDEITVFFTSNKAQAIRTNARSRKQQSDGVYRLVSAIKLATNCKVDPLSIEGDIVLITTSIEC